MVDSETSSAFKALTDALGGCFDPKWEQYAHIKGELQLVQSQKHQLVKLQSRLKQNNVTDENKTQNLLPVPGRARTPTQFQNVLNGGRIPTTEETSVSMDFHPRTNKPTRPLRARELEAIKQLSSSSQDVTMNGFMDLFPSDSSTESIEFFKSTEALNNIRRRESSRRSRGNENWSEPSSISNAQGIRMQPLNSFEVSRRLEQYLPRANPTDATRNKVIDQQFYTGSNRDKPNGIRLIHAPSIKSREVIIRDSVDSRSPKYKRTSRIIIQKQLPSQNGLHLGWLKQTDRKAASIEHLSVKPGQTDHKSPRLTIIDHSLSSPERAKRGRGTLDSVASNHQQLSLHPQRLGGAETSKVKTFEVITTYPYAAQDTDELSLRLNEVVRVLPWPEGMDDVSIG
ncbi:unnamed protein product [Echinostoma caproni]|uniref:SPX domain-containing protein n=1 Tax=Echinostoma caproni TaxID=27848 RepID=A0A183A930_9TREM|nr:unnamed protein product [Echinostoma caproni]